MSTPYRLPLISGLTDEEQALCRAMVDNWSENLAKNTERAIHYGGHVDVAKLDLGISVPPPIVAKLRRQPYMWCAKAVNALADCSTFDGFAFLDDQAPEGFEEAMQHIDLASKYERAKTSELVHCSVLWTVGAGDAEKGEPPVVVNCYDMLHSTYLWDYRHDCILCALVVTDVDPKRPERPTAVNYYGKDSTVECHRVGGKWESVRHAHGAGRPMAEPMRYAPDLSHQMGRSRITRSIMQLEDNANRDAVRMVMHAEVYTAPTRWVMGAPDDIFDGGRWEAYLGSIFALTGDENGDKPTTGSYPVGDVEPLVRSMRHWANVLSSEASIPVHELLNTEANPASSDAIIAAENAMVKRAQDMNRENGGALRNVGLLVCSLLAEKPVAELDAQALTMKAKWKNPAHPSMASQADAMVKLAGSVPAFSTSRVFWEQLGFDEPTVDRIMADIRRSETRAALNAAVAANPKAVNTDEPGA